MVLEYDSENAEIIVDNEGDMEFVEDFEREHDLPEPAGLVQISTGREYESDGNNIRTKPDPTVCLYPLSDSVIVALSTMTIIFKAFQTTDDAEEFLSSLVASIEEDYEGVCGAHVKHKDDEADYMVEHIASEAREYAIEGGEE